MQIMYNFNRYFDFMKSQNKLERTFVLQAVVFAGFEAIILDFHYSDKSVRLN